MTLLVVQLATAGASEDHLRPDVGVLAWDEVSSYEITVARALFPYGPDIRRFAQFVPNSPGPAPERAVFIRASDAGGFEVEAVQLKTKLWKDIMDVMSAGKGPTYVGEQAIAAAIAKVTVTPERRRAPIDEATMDTLIDVWNLAIDEARFTRAWGAHDINSYDFTDPTYGIRGGSITEPPAHTRMSALVALGEALFAYGWERVDPAKRIKRATKLRADALRLKAAFTAPPH
jgi:hypothetical protein